MRKMVGIFTAVTAALLVVGVAWAANDPGDNRTLAPLDVSSASSPSVTTDTTLFDDDSSSTSTPGSSSSSSSAGSSSSTSTPGGSSSTSSPGSSSSSSSPSTTTPGSSTSTTVEEEFVASGGGTFQVAPGISVTVDIQGGALVLVGYSAPGWDVEIKDVRSDRIKIEFEKASAEAKFEAELDDGRLEIEIKRG